MRVILIRSAKNTNEVLADTSYDVYTAERSEDPLIINEQDIINLANNLKNSKFKIDKCKFTFNYNSFYSYKNANLNVY